MPLIRAARIIAIVFLLASMAIAALAWVWFFRPLALPVSPFAFEVRAGSSFSTIARELATSGVIAYAEPLIALARLQGVDRAIKAGSYEFETGTTLPQLLAKLTQGDVTQSSFVIMEGSTFSDLKRALKVNTNVKNTVLDSPDAELLAQVGVSEASPEGLFFPDTYYFAVGATDVSLLKRAYKAMDERLVAAWEKRSGGLPLASKYEVLVLASIVEKETGRGADRPLIASVFVNRLVKGMRLQTDPTVIYGLGSRFDGNLRKRDLEADTPWNTYTRDGLPPTPIAYPSQAAIDAVVQPPRSDFFYFVARGDGSSQFSANLDDHNRAVARFQKGSR